MPTYIDEEYVKIWEEVNAKQEAQFKAVLVEIEKKPKAQWTQQQHQLHTAITYAMNSIDPKAS